MSEVPAEARGKQAFKPLIDARLLCKYTLEILKNEKHFKSRPSGDEEDDAKNPPQPELIAKMRDTVMDIYITAFSANEVKLTNDPHNYRHRRQLQDKSIARCNELRALVEMSIPIFHIPARRVDHWGGMIELVRNQVQKWKESDYNRYMRM